jgi:hypothetical protein
LAFEHLNLLLHRVELFAAKGQQGRAALVLAEQLVQRQLTRVELGHQALELLQCGLVARGRLTS